MSHRFMGGRQTAQAKQSEPRNTKNRGTPTKSHGQKKHTDRKERYEHTAGQREREREKGMSAGVARK